MPEICTCHVISLVDINTNKWPIVHYLDNIKQKSQFNYIVSSFFDGTTSCTERYDYE